MSFQNTRFILAGIFLLILSGLTPSAYALEWQDVANELMSPACPGRTLINCTSGQSEQLRELIRQKVAQGESKSAIMRYFVDMHGEEILAAPPEKGVRLGRVAVATVRGFEWCGFDYGADISLVSESCAC